MDTVGNKISIAGLAKAALAAALYNAARPQGMGFMAYDPKPLGPDFFEAHFAEREALANKNYMGGATKPIVDRYCYDFDYVFGRAVKANISGDELNPADFDHDNGAGACAAVVESLRETGDVNNAVIQAIHAGGTQDAIEKARRGMKPATTPRETVGKLEIFTLDMADVADVLGPKIDEAEQSVAGGGR